MIDRIREAKDWMREADEWMREVVNRILKAEAGETAFLFMFLV